MMFSTRYTRPVPFLLMAFGLIAASAPALAASEFEGPVPEITTQKLFFDGKYYALVQGAAEDNSVRWPQATECHVKTHPSYQLTCGSLAQVGYIHKARLRIENGKVARVEVLEMMQ